MKKRIVLSIILLSTILFNVGDLVSNTDVLTTIYKLSSQHGVGDL